MKKLLVLGVSFIVILTILIFTVSKNIYSQDRIEIKNRLYVIDGEGVLRKMDLNDERILEIAKVGYKPPFAMAISEVRNRLYVIDGESVLLRVDLNDESLVKIANLGDDGNPHEMFISEAKNSLYIINGKGILRRMDLTDERVIEIGRLGARPHLLILK